jgi:carboxypeptidase Taq
MSTSAAVSTVRANYNKLQSKLQKIALTSQVSGLMEWDQLVMLPPKAAENRGNQSAIISEIVHEMKVEKSLGDLISELQSASASDLAELNDFERANIALASKNYNKETKVPGELVSEMAKLGSTAYFAWVQAKNTDDYSLFEPHLAKWIELKTKWAKLVAPNATNVYDVLLDEFDRDVTSADLEANFSQVKAVLVPIISKILKAKPIDTAPIKGKFPIKKQEELSRNIVTDLGYDWQSGRLDVSVHPFTASFGRNDVRITTRYREDDYLQGLSGSIHETGHALYEQGLNDKYYGTPAAEANGMTVHESQSLLWERHVGLSDFFVERYWPLVQKTFAEENPSFADFTSEQVYKAWNAVEPGFIRVEADEVCYPMHVILRFELEKGLFDGSISVKELPQKWNELFEQYLGIKVPNNKLGVLQDVHHSAGLFSYFPTYFCGAQTACQIFNTAAAKIPNFDEEMKKGNFSVLKNWLNENVHSKGSVKNRNELLKEVTGEPLNPSHFLNYIKTKYSKIYGIEL